MQTRLKVISPHLNIYNLELQSGLSILNRISGLFLSFYIYYFFVIEQLFCQTLTIDFWKYSVYWITEIVDKDFTSTIGILMSLIILIHFMCGIRHIIWDFNIGLNKKPLKISNLIIITILLTSFSIDLFFQVMFALYFDIISHQ